MGSKIDKFKRYLVAGSLLFHIGKSIAGLFKKIRKKIDFAIGFVVRKVVYRKGEICPNKIFVMTYDNAYSCNPRYIIEEVIRRKLPVKIVWAKSVKKAPEGFPPEVELVNRGSYAMFHEMSSAKIWIDNALNCVWYGMPKKDGQVYINTWHGSLGIKRLSGNRTWKRRAKRCNRLTDYCIANSAFEEDVFRDTFWKNVPYLKYGHARNDVFFDAERSESLKEKVYNYFELEDRPKLFLYAPTFRDDRSLDWLTVDFGELKQSLEKRFGGEWKILVRMHYKDKARKNIFAGNDGILNASNYGDMQELLPAMDAGMTDYSSWAYDFVLTRRPLFLYVPDAKKYNNERGFYYPLESTPFPLAANNDELEKAILNFDEDRYIADVNKFLDDKGCYDDGKAAERAVDLIEEILGFAGSAPEDQSGAGKKADGYAG